MTRVWRLAWRESQGMSAPTEHVEHRDTEETATRRAEQVQRTRDVVGAVYVYEISIHGGNEGEAA